MQERAGYITSSPHYQILIEQLEFVNHVTPFNIDGSAKYFGIDNDESPQPKTKTSLQHTNRVLAIGIIFRNSQDEARQVSSPPKLAS